MLLPNSISSHISSNLSLMELLPISVFELYRQLCHSEALPRNLIEHLFTQRFLGDLSFHSG